MTDKLPKHCMVDIETLGTKPGCQLLSIGASVFTRDGVRADFYRAIKMDLHQRSLGLTVDLNTLAWWCKQSTEARAVMKDPMAVTLPEAFADFEAWVREQQPIVRWWAHGSCFDFPILEAAAAACKIKMPWKFQDIRDTRTLFEVGDTNMGEFRTEGHHNALTDCHDQIAAVLDSWATIRCTRLALSQMHDKLCAPAVVWPAARSAS
jgi:hypothetical protein